MIFNQAFVKIKLTSNLSKYPRIEETSGINYILNE